MRVNAGWWASNEPLEVANGRPYGSRWSLSRSIRISLEHRTKHMWLIGSSGSGKSRLLRHMIMQDVHCNRGITLVDSQDLFRELLAEIAELAIPGRPSRQKIEQLGDKLVLVEPARQDHGAPGINVLEARDGQSAGEVIDALAQTIRQLWDESHGPRLADISRHCLLALQELGLTLGEMPRMLTDQWFRQAVVSRVTNPDVRMFFDQHLGQMGAGETRSWLESSRNKFAAFLQNPYVRPILSQARSTISFEDVLNQGKWCVIALSRERMAESRRLFGALLLTLLSRAAISREDTPQSERYFHGVYIDEFSDHFCESIVEALVTGGRKYSLGLTLCHQSLRQPPLDLRPGIIDTIAGNCATIGCFRLGRRDAQQMAAELFLPSGSEVKFQRSFLGIPLERPTCWSLGDERERHIQELMEQRPTELYLRIKGESAGPSMAVVPNVTDISPNNEKVEMLREHIARRFYRPIGEINREIEERTARINSWLEPERQRRRDFRW